MKHETEREQLRGVASRWREAYPREGRIVGDKSTKRIQDQLDALDVETATAADVAAIIGNKLWVCAPTCNECGEDSWDAVELGEPPDYESATATICADCLRKALALIEAHR